MIGFWNQKTCWGKKKEERSKKEGYIASALETIFVVYEERFPKGFTRFQDPPVPNHCSTKDEYKLQNGKNKCVPNFSEEELEKRWSELGNKEDWDEECKMCERPVILHIGPCERKIEVGEDEYREIWREWCSLFGKMESIRKMKEYQEEKKVT